jgi:hypothetical protein
VALVDGMVTENMTVHFDDNPLAVETYKDFEKFAAAVDDDIDELRQVAYTLKLNPLIKEDCFKE